jgi:hypothetical protein
MHRFQKKKKIKKKAIFSSFQHNCGLSVQCQGIWTVTPVWAMAALVGYFHWLEFRRPEMLATCSVITSDPSRQVSLALWLSALSHTV